MGQNMKPITAVFNTDDAFQNKVYAYIKAKTNSSGYLKNLAIQEMLGNPSVTNDIAKEKQQLRLI